MKFVHVTEILLTAIKTPSKVSVSYKKVNCYIINELLLAEGGGGTVTQGLKTR